MVRADCRVHWHCGAGPHSPRRRQCKQHQEHQQDTPLPPCPAGWSTSIRDSVQDSCQRRNAGCTGGAPARHPFVCLPCRVEAPTTTPAQATPAASAAPATLPRTAAAAWPRFRAAPSATTASLKGTAMTPTVCGELGRLAKQLTPQASPHEQTQGSLAGLEVQGWSHSGGGQQ